MTSTFSDNTAPNGAGVATQSTSGTISIAESHFSGNSATGAGGGGLEADCWLGL